MLYLLAYLGGILTIFSPCVLPVLPFVFARTGVSFRRSGLPMLLGMGLSFSAIAALAAVGGGWIVHVNQAGRIVAAVIIAILGLSLLFPSLATLLTRPFVQLGNRLQSGIKPESGMLPSMVLGLATGLLWTPCAGPILGLLLTGAAVQSSGLRTWTLLLVFAAGAACPLAVALLAGGRVFQLMKRSLGAEEWIRRGLGIAVLAGVAAIAFGWDQSVLTRISLGSSSMKVEKYLMSRLSSSASASSTQGGEAQLKDEGPMPELAGATHWINSPPLTLEALRGKVVLIDFWTYSCINCLRSIPYVRNWAAKYASSGLVVVGVHSPEFAFERDETNVERAVRELKVTYPVANDSNLAIWKAFKNEYWPAEYFVDIHGRIRHHSFGEGGDEESEKVIQRLLAERDGRIPEVTGEAQTTGLGKQAAFADMQSPETYIGYDNEERLASPEKVTENTVVDFTTPAQMKLNDWALKGQWNVGSEAATLTHAPGSIVFRFHARDLNLVLGPAPGRNSVRFRVMMDGRPALEEKGEDVDASGEGVVREQRLYQLIRQHGPIQDHTFEIEFLDPGIQAFSFTFG